MWVFQVSEQSIERWMRYRVCEAAILFRIQNRRAPYIMQSAVTRTRCILTAPMCSVLLQHAHSKFMPPLIPASFSVHHLTQALAIASVRPRPSHPMCRHHHVLCAATVTPHTPPLSCPRHPLCVPIHADAPYSPPLALPMPHTAHVLQHAPAVPAPPRHAPTHDNTPGAPTDPIHVPPPPHSTYLTAPTCYLPTVTCHPRRPPTLYMAVVCATATALSVPPPPPSPYHPHRPLHAASAATLSVPPPLPSPCHCHRRRLHTTPIAIS